MKIVEEKEVGKILKDTMMHRTPNGFTDRIMAHVAVIPVKRTSIKPVEPTPVFAVIIALVTVVLLIIALLVKPVAWFSFPWENYFQLNINPIWMTPIIMISITIWGYILINKFSSTSK
ncbi:MAG: hypothetical protein OEW67_07625 [Cyclobacteriaceae bacterium]|nr:hypothetical protein [Cyclobacteriaceae bacterium]